MRIPSQELSRRISTLEEEIKTTHPKSSQLQLLVQIDTAVDKFESKYTNVIFGVSIGELVIGLLGMATTLPNQDLKTEMLIAGVSVTAFLGTMVLGSIEREFHRQRMVSSELAKLDKV